MVVFRYMTRKDRALIFAEVSAEEIEPREKTNANKANGPRTGCGRKRHLFSVYFVEVKKGA